ncbi:MAG: SMI1/KNR4 family protein [Gemmataceae bacterium]
MVPTIDEIETWIGCGLPSGYRSFLQLHRKDVAQGDVCLYGASVFIEMNDVLQTKKHCPGRVSIGNDGGARQFLLGLDNGQIVRVGDDDLGSPEFEDFIAVGFSSWLAAGCPVPLKPDPVYEPTERVAVYLEKPLQSVKTLLLIKDHLSLSTSIAELKKLAQSPPCTIADHLTYAQAIRRCAKVNAVEACLGIRSIHDSSIQLPLEWRG